MRNARGRVREREKERENYLTGGGARVILQAVSLLGHPILKGQRLVSSPWLRAGNPCSIEHTLRKAG